MKDEKESMLRELTEELRKLDVQELVLILNGVNILKDRMLMEKACKALETA